MTNRFVLWAIVLQLFFTDFVLDARSEDILVDAIRIHKEVITIDTHVDIAETDYATETLDPGIDQPNLRCDLVKMERGGLDAVFLAVWVRQETCNASGYQKAHDAAIQKFAAIHRLAETMHPDRCELALSSDDVRRITALGKRAIMIGIENGYPIGTDLSNIKEFYDLGARYITLSHNGHNQICDSCNPSSRLGDEGSKHGGLSDFGRNVVAEMNRLGIIVDVSHLSEESFWDVIACTRTPIIASHSGCRALNDNSRNLSDAQLKALADNGGVIHIVALGSFLKAPSAQRRQALDALASRIGIPTGPNGFRYGEMTQNQERQFHEGIVKINDTYPAADLKDYVDHIDHAVKIAGVDHVGIGTDFDGGGGIQGFDSHADALNVTRDLLERGYTEEAIRKIWGGNLLRVWHLVENTTEQMPNPHRGLYAIWARDDQIRGLDFIRGGQIVLQWSNLQTGPSEFDFQKLDTQLKQHAEAGRPATIQVNGNRKPDFLYDIVPSIPEKLSNQIASPRGSLMYWHPNHIKTYLDFVNAYGEHISHSPYRDIVLGVRLNFNALGTEHLHVPKKYHDAASWQHPAGIEKAPDWTREIMAEYKRRVVAGFTDSFRPHVRVFVRNNVVLDDDIDSSMLQRFESGDLALFHTSSEVQPRATSTERRYEAFRHWARPGKTLAYAESWADAWGRHGGKRDARWCSPCQWNYWRLLVDLHCGVSFIAVYGADLKEAKTDPEFRTAFEFAARYAGYHASPSQSPGAWVALREGEFLSGDYTFLMERLKDASKPVKLTGPSDQRFGAWARQVAADHAMRFRINREFLATHADEPLRLRVVYLDEGQGSFTLSSSHKQHAWQLANTGRWKTAEREFAPGEITPHANSHLNIQVKDQPVTFHMVEVITAH